MIVSFIFDTILFTFFLCWGSFFNVVGHRIVQEEATFFGRSHCPHCLKQLAWYDLIPVVSWIFLKGSCRTCKQPISFLYPFIELITAITFMLIFNKLPFHEAIVYTPFVSALIITVRSDLECMLVSRFCTLFLIPLAWIAAFFEMLSLSLLESICGTFFGYFFLFIVAGIFKKVTKQQGMGEGDFDLLAFIGSFTGAIGCWITVLFGSVIGAICGGLYIGFSKQSRTIRIPFGPFLALGAIIFILFRSESIQLIFN